MIVTHFSYIRRKIITNNIFEKGNFLKILLLNSFRKQFLLLNKF